MNYELFLNHIFLPLGLLPPSITTSSLTSTSITISWSQSPFSFNPVSYTVTLIRVTGPGSGQVLCTEVEDNIAPEDTTSLSMDFTLLEEFSTYRAEVTARFMEFGLSIMVPAASSFITLSAGTVV